MYKRKGLNKKIVSSQISQSTCWKQTVPNLEIFGVYLLGQRWRLADHQQERRSITACATLVFQTSEFRLVRETGKLWVMQLNMYGFCKKEKSEEFLRFTHKIFKKGNDSHFHLIQRKAKVRNIKNSSSKFYQSHNKIISTIKTKSGLNDEAQELTVSLLQFK